MKKIFYSLMCVAALSMTMTTFTSCDKNKPGVDQPGDDEPGNGNGDYNIVPDDPEPEPTYNYDEQILRMEPGLYEILNDDGSSAMIIARSTDNWFYMSNEMTYGFDGNSGKSNFLPSGLWWTDGQTIVGEISQVWIDWDRDENWLTKEYDPEFYYVMTEYSSHSKFLSHLGTEKHSAQLAAMMLYMYAEWSKKKIADAQPGAEMLQTIINHYKTDEVPALSNMVLNYTGIGFGWMNDKYPQQLNEVGYVIPFTGNGTVESISITRDVTWPESIQYLHATACNKVCRVEAVVTCTAEEANKYIDVVREKGNIVRILTESQEENMITFQADEWYEEGGPELPEGTSHYYDSGYEIMWMGGSMTIRCNISKIIYV